MEKPHFLCRGAAAAAQQRLQGVAKHVRRPRTVVADSLAGLCVVFADASMHAIGEPWGQTLLLASLFIICSVQQWATGHKAAGLENRVHQPA